MRMSGVRHAPSGDLHSAEQARAIDARAIHECGIEGFTLMQRAAADALLALRARWPAARDLIVFCGAGNNGGDGYVLARDAVRQGWRVRVAALVEPARLVGDAARAAKECLAAGVPVISLDRLDLAAACHASDVIVDALLGTGLRSAVREPFAAAIRAINAAGRPVLALDVPSGLCADTGRVRGIAVRAQLTVTFIVDKLGLWLEQGPEHVGEVQLATLDLPADALRERPLMQRLTKTALRGLWQRRERAAHKGLAGHVMLVGGGEGMPGAIRLAAEAALFCGAGRVSVLCAPTSVAAVAAGRPEVMVWGVKDRADAQTQLARADVVAIGPGLGLSAWSRELYSLVISLEKPVVVDADALTLLAERAVGHAVLGTDAPSDERACADAPRVWTPHPGEAARLLGLSGRQVQEDRLAALQSLCTRYPGVSVLKGAGTLLGDTAGRRAICTAGSPAMAAAGMGDVLTGVIAALLAQGASAWDAACTAVWWHATAGDEAARIQAIDRGLLAGQLLAHLPGIFGQLLGLQRPSEPG